MLCSGRAECRQPSALLPIPAVKVKDSHRLLSSALLLFAEHITLDEHVALKRALSTGPLLPWSLIALRPHFPHDLEKRLHQRRALILAPEHMELCLVSDI